MSVSSPIMTLNTRDAPTHPQVTSPHVGPPSPEVSAFSVSGTLGMLLATLLWGCSFTWVKAAGSGINASLGNGVGSPIGPVALLGWRFAAAAVLWTLFLPRSLNGWSRRSFGRGALLGCSLFVPMFLQVLGLDRTSEALSAFLTSLTIIFVPLTLALFLGRPPHRQMWVAVGFASVGIWLMTGAEPTGFGVGALFGLLCGMTFTAHILLLDGIMKRETLGRMTVAQFTFVGATCLATCLLLPGGRELVTAEGMWKALAHGADSVALTPAGLLASDSVALNLFLVTLVSTLGAFTLQFAFQPRITPTLAALILLAEPIFAALFAYAMLGRSLGATAIAGAGLILAANVYAILRNAARA